VAREKKPRKAHALTEEEEQVLWRMVLGQENPKSLNYTVFFLFGQHFGTRGRQEHHQIQIEDLKQIRDPAGKLVQVEWMEGPTKTRQGGLNRKPRAVTQKLFELEDHSALLPTSRSSCRSILLGFRTADHCT